MTQFEIVEGQAFHCGRIARRLRQDHAQEFVPLYGNVHRELRAAFDRSSFTRAWLADGQIVALGGVIGTPLSSTGFVWLAMTEEAKHYPLQAVREAKRQLAIIMQTKVSLRTKLLPADAPARKLALLLGFQPVGEGEIEYRREWPETSDPFVVFSLPRSRSRWLTGFLSNAAECSHDLPVTVGSVNELVEAVCRGGTVETGLASAWRVLRDRIPNVKFAVVLRPVAEVRASAAAFGWNFPEGYLEAQEAGLREIAALPGTLVTRYAALESYVGCKTLYEHCTGRLLGVGYWRRMDAQNIQIDMAARLQLLTENAGRLGKLFDEIEATVTIQEERFDPFYRDAQALLKAHYEEAGGFGGMELDPDIEQAQALESIGRLLVVTARRGGRMIGYIMFFVNPAFENKHTMLGFQNIYFVDKPHRGRLGKTIRQFAISKLKDMGVKGLINRAGVRARGPHSAAMYEREGGICMGTLYFLRLED